MAVFLLTTLILSNAVFVRSVLGNRGFSINPDFSYSNPIESTSESLGYLVDFKEKTPNFSPKTEASSESPLPGALLSGQKSTSIAKNEDLFILPTEGFNWGEIHSENAVDIANYCGAPVFSTYPGQVIPDENYGLGLEGWNGGYGLFVLISHSGNLKTRYAHLEKIMVKVGDYVRQGTLLGYVGSSGKVHGPTGCHLHFEVLGGENPFAN